MKHLSVDELAGLTGKAWRTVKRRIAEADIAPNEAGKYASPAALAAIYGVDVSASSLATAAKARRDNEAADKLAMENAEHRGDLARVSVMTREVGQMLADHRQNALGLPSKLAPRLVGLEADPIRAKIEDAIYELLGDLADYRPEKPKRKRATNA